MSSFIPSSNPQTEDVTISNDGFYPDLSLNEMKQITGLGDHFKDERVTRAVQLAMIEVNASITAWRLQQMAYQTLDDVPSTMLGTSRETIILYQTAVYVRARGSLMITERDYDSTKTGHDRADDLENSATEYFRESQEALARLTGRGRTIVELI